MRIVKVSERCFSSTLDVVVVSDELKPNLSSRNLASIIFPMALANDCWKLAFIKVMRTTFSVPQWCSCWEESGDTPTRWLNNCTGRMLSRYLAWKDFDGPSRLYTVPWSQYTLFPLETVPLTRKITLFSGWNKNCVKFIFYCSYSQCMFVRCSPSRVWNSKSLGLYF